MRPVTCGTDEDLIDIAAEAPARTAGELLDAAAAYKAEIAEYAQLAWLGSQPVRKRGCTLFA